MSAALEIRSTVLKQAFLACRQAFLYVAIFSLVVNLLMLTVAIYTLQLFDRVFASFSYNTLLYLTIIATFAIGILALLDYLRGRMLLFTSHWLDNQISPEALNRSIDILLQGQTYPQQSLRDISQIRGFLSGPGVLAFLDAPWIPIYLLVIFILHPLLGVISLIGAILLFLFAYLNEKTIRKKSFEINNRVIKGQNQISATLRNAESIQAMGMLPQIIHRWSQANEEILTLQAEINSQSGHYIMYSKFTRLFIQILILAAGAYLVVENRLTAGTMIAASIILSRALAPIEQAISVWGQFINARQAYLRLDSYFNLPKQRTGDIVLPKPIGNLRVEGLGLILPGAKTYVLKGINLNLDPGEILAIIGPSASGKSSLARTLLGILPPTMGSVRLDGAEVYSWDRKDFGKYIGYLPQNIELFFGSVKENIARMETSAKDEDIIQAAKDANVHEMILKLKEGYETIIQENAQNLSAGQQQRIALARTFFGNPQLIVLDEPNAHLDTDGEAGLIDSLLKAKQRGATIVVIAHRPGLLQITDKILILQEGSPVMLGPSKEILEMLRANAANRSREHKGSEDG